MYWSVRFLVIYPSDIIFDIFHISQKPIRKNFDFINVLKIPRKHGFVLSYLALEELYGAARISCSFRSAG